MEPTQNSDGKWQEFARDPLTRREVVSRSHFWFFHLYFDRYATYSPAPFHMEFFAITENAKLKTAVIESFRNSGKTTLMNFSYPLWAVLGGQRKKFVLLVARTESQARQYLTNIKSELENNKLLCSDSGPFKEPDDEWRSSSIVLPQYDARITAVSIEQSVRGLRHGPHRPDLILCDDLEDLSSVKTLESRDRLYSWLTGDIIPMGDINTKMVVIGTRLHEDSLIMRLKAKIESGEMLGQTFHYPLVDRDGKIAWPSKFPNVEAIDAERKKIGNDIAWRREYLLEIVADENQIIKPEWIRYYDDLPPGPPRYAYTMVDPAMSQKKSADKTAMVSAYVYGKGEDLRIYILSNPVNKKGMQFSEMLERMRELSRMHGRGSGLSKLFIEDVGLQAVGQIQILRNEGYPIEGYKAGSTDKHEKLMAVSNLVQYKVFFPRKTCEVLIQQLLFFGVERYDDLMDAFAMLLGRIMFQESKPVPRLTFINRGGFTRQRGRSIWDDDDSDGLIDSSWLWGKR